MAKDKADEATLRIVTGLGSEISVDPTTGEVLSDEERRRTLRDMMDGDEGNANSYIDGDQAQMTMIVASPNTVISSRLKVKAFDVGVKGQFKEGTKVRLVIEVEAGDVNFKRRKDSMGYITGVERIHTAEVVEWSEA